MLIEFHKERMPDISAAVDCTAVGANECRRAKSIMHIIPHVAPSFPPDFPSQRLMISVLSVH